MHKLKFAYLIVFLVHSNFNFRGVKFQFLRYTISLLKKKKQQNDRAPLTIMPSFIYTAAHMYLILPHKNMAILTEQ